jgi:hypothetical protein
MCKCFGGAAQSAQREHIMDTHELIGGGFGMVKNMPTLPNASTFASTIVAATGNYHKRLASECLTNWRQIFLMS